MDWIPMGVQGGLQWLQAGVSGVEGAAHKCLLYLMALVGDSVSGVGTRSQIPVK